jgi:hypothetical protein
MSADALAAIFEAIAIAEQHGGVVGAPQKAWVIDQMVRALVGVDYEHWVAAYESGDDGPHTYAWVQGVAP